MAILLEPGLRVTPVCHTLPVGARWWRLYRGAGGGEPLGFSRRPGRFSDPQTPPRYGVYYAARSLEECFVQTVLRDRGDGRQGPLTINVADLEMFSVVEVEIAQALRLIDLRHPGPLRMGVPSDVTGARDLHQGQVWGAALWAHPDGFNGIIYPSRFSGDDCIALFDRAAVGLGLVAVSPLLGATHADRLAALAARFAIDWRR